MQQEWVEVRGPSVEEAVQAGLDELGISSPEQAEIEVIQEPKRRFLVRVQDAVVRIKAKPAEKKRRRRRRRSGSGGEGGRGDASGGQRKSGERQGGGAPDRQKGRALDGQKGQGRDRQGSRQRGGGKPKSERGQPPERKQTAREGDRRSQERTSKREQGGSVAIDQPERDSAQPKPEPTEQAQVVVAFLEGLLEAFGLDGSVDSRIEDGAIYVDVTGEQTEALVGPKGAIMQAILELSRTVVQRKTFGSARLRLDIAGYAARRHKALEIYAERLAEQVKQDGEEVMLEAMNPADRKVVHDAVGAIEGVRTYSEGQEPNRSVIIALSPGVEPAGPAADEAEREVAADQGDEAEPDDATDRDDADQDDDADTEAE